MQKKKETTEEEVVGRRTTEEEVVAEAPDYTEIDIEEDVNALLGGEELSEEFKEKAKTIFEAAIKGKVAEIKETLEAEYAEKLVEEVEEIKRILLMSVLILTLSMLLTSGCLKINSQLKLALRPI